MPEPPLLVAFRQWMHVQRGTQASTLDNYAVHVDALLRRVEADPVAIDARTLRQFVLDGHTTQGWASAKKRTTALRMFVRFLVVAGHSHEALIGAIPVLAHWRLAGLPRYLSTEEVGRIIASAHREADPSAIGREERRVPALGARNRAWPIAQLERAGLSRGSQRGGSVPPSASVLMFWMARVNVAVRDALSFSRAASSSSIELS